MGIARQLDDLDVALGTARQAVHDAHWQIMDAGVAMGRPIRFYPVSGEPICAVFFNEATRRPRPSFKDGLRLKRWE